MRAERTSFIGPDAGAGAGAWSAITGACTCTRAGACASDAAGAGTSDAADAGTRSQTRVFSSSKETLHIFEQNTTPSSWLVTTHEQTIGLWSGLLHSAHLKYIGVLRYCVDASSPSRVPSHAAHVQSGIPIAITLPPPPPHDVARVWTLRMRGQLERLQSIEFRCACAPGLLWRRRIKVCAHGSWEQRERGAREGRVQRQRCDRPQSAGYKLVSRGGRERRCGDPASPPSGPCQH